MLTTLIFGVTPSLTESVSRRCSEFGDICVYKTLDSYRSRAHTKSARLLNTHCPDLIFLQLTSAEGEEECVSPEATRRMALPAALPRPLDHGNDAFIMFHIAGNWGLRSFVQSPAWRGWDRPSSFVVCQVPGC